LERDEAEAVGAGDLVAIAGVEGIQIGESITDLATPQPLEPLLIDEPTLAMIFTVNSSPLSGKEGSYLIARPARPLAEGVADERIDSRGRYGHAGVLSRAGAGRTSACDSH
jgi:predicted membrane GTPase involved in stress response